jgi:hypothetical protein
VQPIEIARQRLISQRIANSEFTAPAALVAWMGALQAQDFPMSLWAIGIRLPGVTASGIEAAMNRGEILRTHLLRPTWHIVAAEDIGWMLALTAPHINRTLTARHKQLGLTDEVFRQSQTVLEHALREGDHLTRDELFTRFGYAKLETGDNRGYHMLVKAELDGLICSGKVINGKQTYALLAERVSQAKSWTKDESLATLAKRYFASRGPATLADFTWWSGLPAGEARRALGIVQTGLMSVTREAETYWYGEANQSEVEPAVLLLPAYDEFLISYKDRRASLTDLDFIKVVSSNGIFRPIILIDGRVAGIWKRFMKKDRIILELTFFSPPSNSILDQVVIDAGKYAEFNQMAVEIA